MKRHISKLLISGVVIGGSLVTIREYYHNSTIRFIKKFKVHALTKSNEISTQIESRNELKLVLVQVFFRHGARLPISGLPGFDDVSSTICQLCSCLQWIQDCSI